MRKHGWPAAVLLCLALFLGVITFARAYEGDDFPPGGGGYYLMPMPSQTPGIPFIMPEFEMPEYGEEWFRYFLPDDPEASEPPGSIIFGEEDGAAEDESDGDFYLPLPDAERRAEKGPAQEPAPDESAETDPLPENGPQAEDAAPPQAQAPSGEANLQPPPESVWDYLKTLPIHFGDSFSAVTLPLPGPAYALYPLPMGAR